MLVIIDEDIEAELRAITEELGQHYPITVYKRVCYDLTAAQWKVLSDKVANCTPTLLSAQLTYNLSKYFV